MPSCTRLFLPSRKLALVLLFTIPSLLRADKFCRISSSGALQQAATALKADKDAVATILIHEER